MGWFGQGKDTIEWEEFRPDVLFYKWKNKEIKKGSRLIIRPGQKAIFYDNGKVEGVFEEEGNFDIYSDIVPFLSSLSGILSLRSDSGLRAEVYFVNAKELVVPWGTRQRIMIPTVEVPSGIPVGCNGNMIIEFRDYLTFIQRVAGVKSTYSLGDVSERLMGEMNSILPEIILDGGQIGVNALVQLQSQQRRLGKRLAEELDKELFDIGLGVRDVNINSFSYPPEVQKMAEKAAAQSFVDVNRYTQVSLADSFAQGGGGGIAGAAAQMAMGMAMAQQMTGQMQNQNQQQRTNPVPPMQPQGRRICTQCGQPLGADARFCANCGTPVAQPEPPQAQTLEDAFCPRCRKMVGGKFCPYCGTPTV